MTRSFSATGLFSLFLMTSLTAACGQSQDLGADSGGGGDGGGGQCLSMCQVRATGCGEPSSDAVASCNEFCSQNPTSTQIACVESTSCTELANSFSQTHYVCGVPLLGEAGSLPSDCMTICTDRASACGAPADAATIDCKFICDNDPTASQLSCIQTTACSALMATFEQKGTVCGIGG